MPAVEGQSLIQKNEKLNITGMDGLEI